MVVPRPHAKQAGQHNIHLYTAIRCPVPEGSPSLIRLSLPSRRPCLAVIGAPPPCRTCVCRPPRLSALPACLPACKCSLVVAICLSRCYHHCRPRLVPSSGDLPPSSRRALASHRLPIAPSRRLWLPLAGRSASLFIFSDCGFHRVYPFPPSPTTTPSACSPQGV